jgi:membrane dipeptidase
MSRAAPHVADCHSDVMIDVARRRSAGERSVLARLHLPGLRAGGVGLAVCPVGGDVASLSPLGLDRPFESALELLSLLEAEVRESSGEIAIVGSAAEARRALAEGVLGIVPSLEGASALEGGPDRIGELHERGLRWVGLTWNGANGLASGLATPDAGLTRLGVEAIRELNRLGVVVDVTHLSPAGLEDVVRESRAPVVASHSNGRAVWDHPRNLDDSQLDAIRASGGLVGVVLFPGFVGPPPVTVEHVLDHVEYLAGRIGVDSIGIGADFIDYAVDAVLAEMPGTDPASLVYPEGVAGAHELGNLVAGLARRGFSPDEVDRICSGNLLRVLADVEAAVASPA